MKSLDYLNQCLKREGIDLLFKNSHIDNLSLNDFAFSDEPPEIKIEDYDKTKAKIKTRLSMIKDIESIYQIGGAEIIPGISDLDFIIVLKHDLKNSLVKDLSYRMFNEMDKPVLTHDFFLCDELLAHHIHLLMPVFSLKKIYGREVNVIERYKDDELSNIVLMTDIIFRFLPQEYLITLLDRKIRIRWILAKLNVLKYPVHVLSKLCGMENSEWNKHIAEVDYLRKNWFVMDKKERRMDLIEKLKKSVYISMELIEHFANLLSNNRVLEIETDKLPGQIKYYGRFHKTIFTSYWNKETALRHMVDFYLRKNIILNLLPINVCWQLLEYLGYKGVISNYIRKNISVDIKAVIKADQIKMIKERINLLNYQHTFLIKNGFYYGNYFNYGFCLYKNDIVKNFLRPGYMSLKKVIERYKIIKCGRVI